jgi:uncharacterized protein YbcC (UPF0753/DUF2309 family)
MTSQNHAPIASGSDLRSRLTACLEHLEHVLPSQAAIRDFVHHNTLHGFQHLPFAEALAAAQRLTGARVWLPEATYRAYYAQGRIDDSDLDAAIDDVGRRAGIALDATLASAGGQPVTRREVLRLSMLHALDPIPLARFRWLVEESGILQEHVSLWAACLDVLGIDQAFEHPETLLELATREASDTDHALGAQQRFAEQALSLWDDLRGQVGVEQTLGELIKDLTDEDVREALRPLLIRHLAAHLDQGLAPWPNPAQPLGFYAAWKHSASHDLAWTLGSLSHVRDEIIRLPDDALSALASALQQLGLPEECWTGYLERLALELPGWSGMFLWRHWRPGYANTAAVPVDMLDYLAVRVTLEHLLCADIVRRHWGINCGGINSVPLLPALGEYFRQHPAELQVRHAYHGNDLPQPLPEYLLDLIEPHMPAVGDTALPQPPGLWEWLAGRIAAWQATPSAERSASHSLTRSAWPLFCLARQLQLTAADLRGCGRNGAEALLGGLRQLDPHQRGFLWLNAYERHYREQILTGLVANHGRWVGHPQGPAAQLVFCMDDREEGIRRHLEEQAPSLATLGGAAHFAVFQNYYGLDDTTPTPLCPVIPEVIVPAHNVHEVPRHEKVGAGTTARRHHQRHTRRLAWRENLHQLTRHAPLAGGAIAVLAAPFALASLLWRSLVPASFGLSNTAWRVRYEGHVPTRLDHNAPDDAGPATPQVPREGFTDAEQAERIGNFLTALGLTRAFAPLLVIMGHGSNSTNNPHLAAYDCGACSGRHSGPNARLFAAMANRSEVRARLAERGIHIPAATWFIGAEHNTADDSFEWYDLDDLPEQHAPLLARIDQSLAAAGQAHAQERCRRLYSAPLNLTPLQALRHVIGRRHDFAQPRPELGHVANACAFFGRREMSRGAFFDRRAFLISYDPTQDVEGKVLERHLLINGAVGAGISLEYFFSTVNNEHFGCGSKVMHNVAGYVGVMQGANSDLRTGLPKQMIEIHEAMRLLVVIEQTLEIITAVYQRQPPLQELVGNGWVIVAAKHPESGAIHLFDPARGWQAWQPAVPGLPTVHQSVDWFAGEREPLPPVLLEKPLVIPEVPA